MPRVLRIAVQLCVTLGAFVYLFSKVDRQQLAVAWSSIPAAGWAGAGFWTAAALSCGICRWWLLFRAFGAPRPPRLTRLASLYMAGLFYNTFLPGGLAGDVVRGFAARTAFEPGSAGGFASVLVERALGLAGLLGVAAGAMLVHPLPGTRQLVLPAIAAFVAGVIAVISLVSVGRLSRVLPGVLQRLLARVPVPSAWTPLALGLLLSSGSQTTSALCGHVLLASIHPELRLVDSLVIVPLAAASAFLPISMAGIGVRETVFVELYARAGVPAQAALAAALGMLVTQALFAVIGGTQLLPAKREP